MRENKPGRNTPAHIVFRSLSKEQFFLLKGSAGGQSVLLCLNSSFVPFSYSSINAAKERLNCTTAQPGVSKHSSAVKVSFFSLKKKKKRNKIGKKIHIINRYKIKIHTEDIMHTIAGKQECSHVFLCQWVSVFCKHFHPVGSLVGLHLLAGSLQRQC